MKSYLVIDLGSFKCYVATFITNLRLLYIRMGDTVLNMIMQRNPFRKWAFSTRWHEKQDKK